MTDALSPAAPEPDPSGQPPRDLSSPPSNSPSSSPGQSTDGTLPLREKILKLLTQGLGGYRQVLEEMSPEISAEEAEEAERASRKSLRLLAAAIVIGVCVQLLIYRVPKAPFNFQGFFYDLFNAGSLVVPLFLVSASRVHFAGRLLLPLAAIGSLYRPPFMPWEFSFYATAVFVVLAVSFAVGRLLDFGASTTPGRKRPGLRRWTLLALGLILLGLSWSDIEELGGYFPALTLLACVVCCAWGWRPGRWLERRASLPKVDEETLRLAAMMRWGLFAWGRALAVFLGLLPLFLFLNGLDLASKLHWPDDPDVIQTTRGGEKQVWFWHHKGTFLTRADLEKEELYAFRDSGVSTEKRDQIWALDDALRGTLYNPENFPKLEKQYNQLRELLAGYRVKTPAALSKIFTESSAPGESESADRIELYHLARNDIVAQGPMRTVPAIFSVENQLWEDTKRLVPMTRDDIESATAHNAVWQWLLLSFGLMGFTFLWRRGGDSALGRWLGIWLIGVGIIGTYRYVLVFLPALSFDLWHRSLEHPAANLWLSIIVVLQLITAAVAYMFLLFVPCAALWVHMCWPAPRRDARNRPWLAPLAFAGRIVLVAFCMSFCFFGSLFGLRAGLAESSPAFAEMTSGVVAVILFVAVACALGFGLRRRMNRRSPLLDGITSSVLLAVQVVTLVAISNRETGAEVFKAAGLVLGFTLLAGLVALIFRKDLLHVSAARDFSFVIAFLILPAVFTWSEEWVEKLISDLMQGAVGRGSGFEILWVVIAVALLPPFRRALEQGILYLSNPRLGHLRRSIEEALEELVTVRDEDSVRRIRVVLRSCGVEDFVLYQRTGLASFEAVGWEGPHTASPPVQLSPPLRRFLSRQRDFVDLDRVALEWRFFFVQFELHRLRGTLGGRYLLPICLGTSLRAFLVVQEGTVQERRVVGSPVVGEITTLGLAAASLRAVAQTIEPAAPATASLSEPAEGGQSVLI